MNLEKVIPFEEGIDVIKEAGVETFVLCDQCGLCNTLCPWNAVTTFMVRRMVRQAQFGLSEIESEEVWRCTTCGNCIKKCPRGVKITDLVVSLRKIASKWGNLPKTIRGPRASLSAAGNPWGGKRRDRDEWARGVSAKTFTNGTEFLYFPCCALIYDQRLEKIALATVNILQKLGIDFGVLGSKVSCCGESIRKVGEEELFQRLAKENIKTFIENGVKKILVSSPHCYQAFKNEYSEFGVDFEVIHISQFLAELINKGRLEFTKEYSKKVTYHDPCYLGRYNNVYDQPRAILKIVPGLDLIEMTNSRENSFCCGGGGGRIWMETQKDERLSNLRLEQAIEVGATVLVTSCPYCITNFEDSKLVLEKNGVIEIKDVTEIIQEVI